MRLAGLSVGSVLLIGLRCFGQTSPAPQPVFSISVAPPAGPIHLGLPINITVTVTNVSSEEIDWRSDRSSDTVYRAFTVMLTKNGSEVETTVFDRKITGRHRTSDPREVQPGSSISLPHPPGKMFVMTIDLTRLYEITAPGVYTLVLSRYDDYSKTTVRSNTVNLNIVP